MKTFTFRGNGSLSEGISTCDDEKFGTVVFLGESGRGRRYAKVGLFRKNPAKIADDGRIYGAHPVKITVGRGTDKEKSFITLAEPHSNGDGRMLVRVCTQCVYTRDTVGSWTTMSGDPQTLVTGYGAHGIAGRIGNWDDGLVIIGHGDVLKVKPEGGYKVSTWALFLDSEGELQTMVYSDYEALHATTSGDEDAEVEIL